MYSSYKVFIVWQVSTIKFKPHKLRAKIITGIERKRGREGGRGRGRERERERNECIGLQNGTMPLYIVASSNVAIAEPL